MKQPITNNSGSAIPAICSNRFSLVIPDFFESLESEKKGFRCDKYHSNQTEMVVSKESKRRTLDFGPIAKSRSKSESNQSSLDKF
jgi:hypothetical protein